MTFNRRKFLSMPVLGAASYQRVLGANNRLGIALIGCGRRGREVMNAFLQTGLAELRVLCDVYDLQRERARQVLVKDVRPDACVAHEEAISHPGVDAVLIATPDHLHVDIAVAALAAGRAVYLEKPATHHWEEGALLLAAARRSGKVCQIGTQQRSGSHYRRIRQEYFEAGKLGQVLAVRAVWHNFPWQARRIAKTPKPPGLDWDRFLGRSPYYEYDAARYDAWRYFPEYGGGVLADIFNHWADVAQWMMNDSRPLHAVSLGGIYHLRDGRVNPDTVHAIVQYQTWNLSFECSVAPLREDRPGVLFQGTEGSLLVTRGGFTFTPAKGNAVEVQAEQDLDLAHSKDFLEAVLHGKKPSCDVETGLEGLRPCYLARTAYWSGKRASYDAARNLITS
ncbi:MAG: Gfo/Idh/MocA family oxidoreductase [Bryobacteraceae bacterium]|nr:Gfo/Idh/MocA family oxidoreductase [Bryobacteraceae bacterium]MDW8376930.1 Gfo/Idh/MocA family oxidoreductase [Bryobacterales bacterium]